MQEKGDLTLKNGYIQFRQGFVECTESLCNRACFFYFGVEGNCNETTMLCECCVIIGWNFF